MVQFHIMFHVFVYSYTAIILEKMQSEASAWYFRLEMFPLVVTSKIAAWRTGEAREPNLWMHFADVTHSW